MALSLYPPLSLSHLSTTTSLRIQTPTRTTRTRRFPFQFFASLTSPSPSSPESTPSSSSSNPTQTLLSPNHPETTSGTGFNYAIANPNGNPVVRLVQSAESNIEKAIFDFRFLALLAIGGSLAGSLLCFLNGCVYIVDAYKVYWASCVKGIHTGQMVLRLVEAIDVFLAGTVMLIFGMGLYGLFISNVPPDVPPSMDRALKGSSLFGMFALKTSMLIDFMEHTTGDY